MENVAPSGDGTSQSRPELTNTSPAMAGAEMLRMVAPRVGGRLHVARSAARYALGEAAAWLVVALVLVVLLAPAAILVLAGCWAFVTFTASAVTLYHLAASSRLGDVLPPLQALDIAGRVVATSASYFALLASLLVLEAGLLGSRWRRLFLLPGIVLTIPCVLLFYFALRLLLDAVSAVYPLSPAAQTALTLYLVLDAVVLGACLVDLRPRRRRRRAHRWRRSTSGGAIATVGQPEIGQPAAPSMPLVHFGPPSLPLAQRAAAEQSPAVAAELTGPDAVPITPDPPHADLPSDDPPEAPPDSPRERTPEAGVVPPG